MSQANMLAYSVGECRDNEVILLQIALKNLTDFQFPGMDKEVGKVFLCLFFFF